MTLHEMRRALKKKVTELKELRAIEKPTPEDQDKIIALLDEMEELTKDIKTEERAKAALESAGSTDAPEPETRESADATNVEIPDVEMGFGEILQRLAYHTKSLQGGGSFRDEKLMQYSRQVRNAYEREWQEYRAITGAGERPPEDGGFMVDQPLGSKFIDKIHQTGQVASMCDRTPIGAGANGIKFNGIDETSRADGSRWGGVRAYWTDEAAAMTASQPKFSQVSMSLEKLTCLFYATDELLQDSAALASRVESSMTQELAFKLDDAIIEGDGAGKPLGLLNAPCTISVAAETSQASSTIVAENIIKMYSRIWAPSRARAIWIANADVIPQLYTMSIAVGTGGVPIWIPGNNMSNTPSDTLLGKRIIYVEQCETLGTAGDIYLADMSQYGLIEKGGVQSAMSIHVRFLNNETVFRFIMRTNGQPYWKAALTPFKGSSNTVSPFINLAVRS